MQEYVKVRFLTPKEIFNIEEKDMNIDVQWSK